MRKILTLCLVHQPPRILLGLKKRGFGMGKWNGFGGKVEPGETLEEAAKRELYEEAGIVARDLTKVGRAEFFFPHDDMILEVHFFSTNQFTGAPIETEEMKPAWFHEQDIPFDTMWPDDRYWFPLFLAGKKFVGSFTFDSNHQILHQELLTVDEL